MKKLKRILKRLLGMEILVRDYSSRELYAKGYVVSDMEKEISIECE